MDEESIRRSITPKWASYKRLFARYFLAAATVLTVAAGTVMSFYLYNRYEKIKSLEYLDLTIKKETMAKIGFRQIHDFNYIFRQISSDKKALTNGYLRNFLKLRENIFAIRFFDYQKKTIYAYDKEGIAASEFHFKAASNNQIYINYDDLNYGALFFANVASEKVDGQLQILFSQAEMIDVLESIYVPNVGQTSVATVYGTIVYPEHRDEVEVKKSYQDLFLSSSGQKHWDQGILTFEIAPPFEESSLENQDTANLDLPENTVTVRFTPLFLMSYIHNEQIMNDFKPVLMYSASTYIVLLVILAFSTLFYARLRRRNEIADKHIIHQKEAAVEKSRLASLGEMAASIAHEINNPLSIIMFNAELIEATLGQKTWDKDKQKGFVSTIFATVERASKIVKGLKSLGRDGTNDPMTSVPIREIIEDAISLVEMKLKKNKVELKIENVPPYFIQCRPGQISQVLINLMSNSMYAIQMSKRPWIALDFSEDSQWYYVYVTDAGRGISADVRKRIFEPFFTTKGLNQGTGLGLSLSRRILEDHGGDLTLDGEHQNTRFVMKFPRKLGVERGNPSQTHKVRTAG